MERDIQALVAFIESRHAIAHVDDGSNDCISFAAGAVEAVTGGKVQPLKGKRWNSLKAGLALLKKEGGVEAALDKRFVRVAPAHAHRGDLAGVVDPVLGMHPAVVEGATLVGPGPSGNVRLPRSEMVAAWDVTRSPAKPKAKSKKKAARS